MHLDCRKPNNHCFRSSLATPLLARLFHTLSSLRSGCVRSSMNAGFRKPAPHSRKMEIIDSVSGSASAKSPNSQTPALTLGNQNSPLRARVSITRKSHRIELICAPRALAGVIFGLGLVALAFFLSSIVSAHAAPGCHVQTLNLTPTGKAGFTLIPPQTTGVWFTNTLSPDHAAENQIRLNGSGVALGDVDGDGLCDLFVCACEQPLALYRNLGGWRFTNITDSAGLLFPGNYSTGATFADVDGDGDLDLLINGIGTGTKLFLNDSHGHFTRADDAGLAWFGGAMTSTMADIDGDGDLDLYVTNYRTNTVRTTGFALLNVGGRRMIPPEERGRLELTPDGRVLEHGEPHFLYINDGKGHFRPVSWTGGRFLDEDGRPLKEAPRDWGLSAAFRDINGDGVPDLYVCNDFHSPDRVWINDGRGRFRAIPRLAIRHTATFSMAVDFADVDRDGRDDILSSDMTSIDRARRLMQIAGMAPYSIEVGVFDDRPQLDRTVLHWNRGDGTYAEIAHYAGLENSEWNWSVLFLDVDLDGFEDVLAATGHMYDTQDLDAQARIQAGGPYPRHMIPRKLLMLPPLAQRKLVFRNHGNLRFVECGNEWGFNQVGVAHGMALADLDNDGDLDLVLNYLNGALGLYRNESSAPRVAVKLKGKPPNTAGIGARIVVKGGAVPVQAQEMMCGGRYLSCDQALRVFAAGSTNNTLTIEVTWPDGTRSVVADVHANCLYEIIQENAPDTGLAGQTRSAAGRSSSGANPQPYFEDVSGLINHQHHENIFDDFTRQPLLPRRLGQLGPGVAWCDLDSDGREDLLIGSGKGGALAVFLNKGKEGFVRLNDPPWNLVASRDQSSVVGWPGHDGKAIVLIGCSTYEDDAADGHAVMLLRSGDPRAEGVVPATSSSVGPMALADFDNDGQLELFVGGRCLSGRYPAPPKSQIWRLQGNKFVPDTTNNLVLEKAGMVSGAVWTDLDNDGWPELVLACEWGPVRVFKNNRGTLSEVTAALGLDKYTGWWNGVAAGDFDGDGCMDIIATNWGLNSPYRASHESPYLLYYGDFNGSGEIDMIEATIDPVSGKSVPERDLDAVSAALPFVRERFPTHAAYGRATVRDLLGAGFAKAAGLDATTLASVVFLNRTNRFELVALPPEAQFATAFAACVADFDGDGVEDVFLSQNFFATHPKVPRCDAGRGLWLRGDGHGGFQPVPGQESGVQVYGEQRGSAVADYDCDGRVDLVVTENGNQTRLFHNVRARPGLRVKLAGPQGNQGAIGAVLRLGSGNRFGPAREIHAGSGYWSQDGLAQVLAGAKTDRRLMVRWPGGNTMILDIPDSADEVTVSFLGQISVGSAGKQ